MTSPSGIYTFDRKMTSARKHFCALEGGLGLVLGLELKLG